MYFLDKAQRDITRPKASDLYFVEHRINGRRRERHTTLVHDTSLSKSDAMSLSDR